MGRIEIKTDNGVSEIYTPYNQSFVSRIKLVGGAKWDGIKKCWTVPEEAVNAVRDILTEVYGCNDLETGETVTVRIRILNNIYESRSDIVFCGKTLCHASGRDSGGRAGNDVFYVSGCPSSSGSVKNWSSKILEGSVIDVANVSKTLLEKYQENPNKDIEIISISDSKVDIATLQEEKERLLKRIAEIDAILGGAK